MKISNRTIEYLKNFSTINESIMFREGSVLSTMSNASNIIASVEVEEQFPQDFGIYNLSEFLNTLSLFDNPALKFEKDFVRIDSGRTKCRYFFASESVITTPPATAIVFPSPEVSFELDTATINRLNKAANTLALSDMSVVPSEDDASYVTIKTHDRSVDSSNTYSADIDADLVVGKSFSFNFLVENLKLIEDSYEVGLSSMKISSFKGKEFGVQYYIALEPSTQYD